MVNPLIKLLQCETAGWIRFEVGIAPKRLGYAFVLVVEDRWKRPEQVSCQNGPVVLRQVLSELFNFSDRGHGTIIVGPHVEASGPRRRPDWWLALIARRLLGNRLLHGVLETPDSVYGILRVNQVRFPLIGVILPAGY